jgi:WD40 repeat protein
MQRLNNGLIATVSNDGSIKLWKSLGLKPYVKHVKTLKGHKTYANVIKGVNSSVLASGGCDSTVKFWNSKNGALLKTLNVSNTNDYVCVQGLEIIPDGRLAVAISISDISSNIILLNLNDFTSSLFVTLPSFILDMSLALNGSVLAVSTNNNCDDECNTSSNPTHDRGSIWLFFIADPDQVFVLGDTGLPNDQDLTDHPDFIHTNGVGELYPISEFILASGSKDKTVKLWNLTSLGDKNLLSPVTLRCQFKSPLTMDTATLNGSPILITGSRDGLINAYDLTQGSTYGNLMSSFNGGFDVGALVVKNEVNSFK